MSYAGDGVTGQREAHAWGRYAVWVLALTLVLGNWLGCRSSAPASDHDQPPPPPRIYAPTGEGLRELWLDVLTAAQKDQRERVRDLMASMVMTPEDLVALFGRERTQYLAPRYAPLMKRLVYQGSLELVAQVYERKYDDVETFIVDGKANAVDRAIVASLPSGVQVFGVRLKRKEDKLGLRYDFFVYRRERWLTGNQIGKYLLDADAGGVDPILSMP
ncbi:MAG TPA: hypothetical protein VH877_21835 [Polyangia bacterium]|nr:hypothetical protein [Polyangia bacterium]